MTINLLKHRVAGYTWHIIGDRNHPLAIGEREHGYDMGVSALGP